MKNKSVLLRLNDTAYAALNAAAANLGISRAEMLRTFLNQGLAGYDRKHAEVIAQFDMLERNFSKSHKLISINTAMVAALDVKRKESSQVTEMISNLEQGQTLCESGILTQRRNICCEGVK